MPKIVLVKLLETRYTPNIASLTFYRYNIFKKTPFLFKFFTKGPNLEMTRDSTGRCGFLDFFCGYFTVACPFCTPKRKEPRHVITSRLK